MTHEIVIRAKHLRSNAVFYDSYTCPLARAVSEYFDGAYTIECITNAVVVSESNIMIYDHIRYDVDSFRYDKQRARLYNLIFSGNKKIRSVELVPSNSVWQSTDGNVYHIVNGRPTLIPVRKPINDETFCKHGYFETDDIHIRRSIQGNIMLSSHGTSCSSSSQAF